MWTRAGAIALAIVVMVAAAAALAVWLGAADVAADKPHTRIVLSILETARSHAIHSRARNIVVPADLMSERRIAAGASEYAEMCSQCHMAPGAEKSELARSLYPEPPDLTHGNDLKPGEQFWVVKHGIKYTAMPAWGKTHDDALLWDIVAFVRKLPSLSAQQYAAMTNNAPEMHDEMMHEGHEHHDEDHNH